MVSRHLEGGVSVPAVLCQATYPCQPGNPGMKATNTSDPVIFRARADCAVKKSEKKSKKNKNLNRVNISVYMKSILAIPSLNTLKLRICCKDGQVDEMKG